jgi:hypothetical protein
MESLERNQRIEHGPQTQTAYERIVDQMATLRMRKVQSYGEARYNDPDFNKMMVITYADIVRKQVRLDNVFANRVSINLGEDGGESLRETLLDQANYCLMMVQQIDHEKDKAGGQKTMEMEKSRQTDHFVEAAKPEPKQADIQVDQVAICTKDPAFAIGLLNEIFGSDEWHKDRVVASGEVFGQPAINEAHLAFNYQLMKGGIEFEVLHYKAGDNWVQNLNPCVSHLGVHVEQLGPVRERLMKMGLDIIQEVATESHTNPAIKDNRRYLYTIFATRAYLGFDLKLIQRMPYEPA